VRTTRQAHATLRNLYTVEQGHLVDHGYYAALGNPYLFTWDDAIRADYDPQFESVLDTGSWEDPLALEIGVGGLNATRICLIVQSKTGRFFVMKLIADTDPDVLEGTLPWEPPLYGYTDNPTGWYLECLSGPTLTYDSWN
jgi:hypothetical protein